MTDFSDNCALTFTRRLSSEIRERGDWGRPPVGLLRMLSVSAAGRPSRGPDGGYSGTISGCAWTRSKKTLSA